MNIDITNLDINSGILNPQISPTYLIFKDGNIINAKNGLTGNIDYRGTDASTIIRNSLSSGGKIFLKKGTYVINSPIVYQKNYSAIEGEGIATELKLGNNVNTDILSANGINSYGILFRNFSVNGNKANNVSGRGIVFSARHSLVDNIFISNCAGNGFECESTPTYNVVNNFINNVRITKCNGIGLIWGTGSGAGVSDNYFQNVISWENTGDGIDLTCAGAFGYNLNSYGNGGHGIIIRSSFNKLVNCVGDGNGKNGFYIYTFGAWYTVITNSNARDNSTSSPGTYHGFHIDGNISTEGRCILENCIATDGQSIKTQGWGVQATGQNINARNMVIGGYFDQNMTGAINVNGLRLKAINIAAPLYENKGLSTFSGTGSQVQFVIPHGLATIPTNVQLEAKSANATGNKYWIADTIDITVIFTTAPPSGINNIILSWKTEV